MQIHADGVVDIIHAPGGGFLALLLHCVLEVFLRDHLHVHRAQQVEVELDFRVFDDFLREVLVDLLDGEHAALFFGEGDQLAQALAAFLALLKRIQIFQGAGLFGVFLGLVEDRAQVGAFAQTAEGGVVVQRFLFVLDDRLLGVAALQHARVLGTVVEYAAHVFRVGVLVVQQFLFEVRHRVGGGFFLLFAGFLSFGFALAATLFLGRVGFSLALQSLGFRQGGGAIVFFFDGLEFGGVRTDFLVRDRHGGNRHQVRIRVRRGGLVGLGAPFGLGGGLVHALVVGFVCRRLFRLGGVRRHGLLFGRGLLIDRGFGFRLAGRACFGLLRGLGLWGLGGPRGRLFRLSVRSGLLRGLHRHGLTDAPFGVSVEVITDVINCL